MSGLETKPVPAPTEGSGSAAVPSRLETRDIRFAHLYLLARSPVRSFVRRLASISTLVLIDLAGLAFGIYAALVLRDLYRGNSPPLWGVLWRQVTDWLPFIAVVAVLVFWEAGLYAPRERRAGFGRVVSALTAVLVITVAFGVGVGKLEFRTFGFFPTALVLSIVLIGLLRASYDAISADLLRASGVRRRVVLAGRRNTLEELHAALGSRRGGIDYDFLGVVSSSNEVSGSLPVLGSFADLPRLLDSNAVGELIVADQGLSEEELMDLAEAAHRRGVKVRVAPKTTELLLQRAEYIPGQGVPLFELRPPILAGADWLVKRSFDLVTSVTAVVLGLPLWLAIAAAIKVSSSGPVFYRDRRVGLRHREFTMLKFRTMIAGADEQQAGLEASNEADGPLFKIRDDPRVTTVGALLRRLSLDEIPQVLNVLRGEMSLVGPRPLRIRDYSQLEEWHRKRDLVLPGMTGLWQISGRSSLGFDDLVRLDFYYIENWSLWLDISILAKTVPAVLARRGAY
ncbi:MAG: sugar transferase [Actinobacteria bacterium]|nr:sugar transferase [Actinomycetota bacterium]